LQRDRKRKMKEKDASNRRWSRWYKGCLESRDKVSLVVTWVSWQLVESSFLFSLQHDFFLKRIQGEPWA
jgi:hypothetical protein